MDIDVAPAVWKARNDGLETREDVLARVRKRIIAAKSRNNQTWEELFMTCDGNKSSALDIKQMKQMIREVMKVPTQTVCDYELKILFSEADKDGSGHVDLAELFEFIQHGSRHGQDEASRLARRLSRVRKNLQIAFQRLSANEADIRRHFKLIDLNSDNTLSKYEFTRFVRMDLKLSRWDVMNADLDDFFQFLDHTKDGVISVNEFLSYIQKNDKDRAHIGAQAFYSIPSVPKARVARTYRQRLQDGIRRSDSLPILKLGPPFVNLPRNARLTTRHGVAIGPNALYM